MKIVLLDENWRALGSEIFSRSLSGAGQVIPLEKDGTTRALMVFEKTEEPDEEPPERGPTVCHACTDGFSEPDPDCPECGGSGEIYE